MIQRAPRASRRHPPVTKATTANQCLTLSKRLSDWSASSVYVRRDKGGEYRGEGVTCAGCNVWTFLQRLWKQKKQSFVATASHLIQWSIQDECKSDWNEHLFTIAACLYFISSCCLFIIDRIFWFTEAENLLLTFDSESWVWSDNTDTLICP